jgi:hypothetical protein
MTQRLTNTYIARLATSDTGAQYVDVDWQSAWGVPAQALAAADRWGWDGVVVVDVHTGERMFFPVG